MEFSQIERNLNIDVEDSVSFREIIEKYLINLKWFVISAIIFVGLAYFYVKRQVPKYNVSATILIKDKEKGNSVDQLAAFEDLGIFGSNNSSLENEIHILTSRRLMAKVVTELELNIRYFVENSPYNLEQYPDFPFTIGYPKDSKLINDAGKLRKDIKASFSISVINNGSFEFIDEEGVNYGNFKFGKSFNSSFGEVIFTLNDSWKNKISGKKIHVNMSSIDIATDRYTNSIEISPIDEKSRVIRISLKESLKQKGTAIINNLIQQYNEDAIEDKNEVYKKTTEFLNDRIILITSELNTIESTVEQFKTSKGLIDTKSGADIFLQSSSTNESQLIDANTQLTLLNHMIIELNKNDKGLLPSNIGLSDPSINGLIIEFNTLVLQRNRILKSSTDKNPLIVGLDNQLLVLKNNLYNSLNSMTSSLKIQVNALNQQRGRISSRIASVPKNEKEFTDIVRQQETKNAVYLFLLQKREESILSNSITINKARIVDDAYSNGSPVSPKPLVTYLIALVSGLLVPGLIIFGKESLDTKVHSEKDLVKLQIPYLGDIPLASSKKHIQIKDGDNSSIAEAFRYIRTNINFMLGRKKKGNTIFVTSTQSGEGKTFTAINLATSLAISGKKTLLLGMDLRAPKITKYLGLEDILGITNLLKNDDLTFEEITETHTGLEFLHVINSGDIPPNPVELLMDDKINDFFDKIKQEYEYVIVDTAPVGMVTDTIQIGKYADMTIYVVKANLLDKRKLHIPGKLHKESKLNNMSLLINGSDHNKGAYGYGYGYGKELQTPWYQFWK